MASVRRPFNAWVSLPLAALVAWSALGGIFLPSTYARETASWAAQGSGQDWVNLVALASAALLVAFLRRVDDRRPGVAS